MKRGNKEYSLVLVSAALIFFLIIFPFTGHVSTAQSDLPAQYAYIPNEKTDDVSVINVKTNKVISTLPVGNNPIGVAANRDGTKVYVTNFGDDNDLGYTFSIISTDTDEVTTRLVDAGKGIKPFGIAIAPDETLYVSSYVAEKVYAINPIKNTIFGIDVGSGPYGVAITPNGKWVYVANNGNNTVSVIDTATNNVIDTVDVESKPYGVAVSPDGAKVYVTNSGNNSISVIDTATNDVTATVKVVNSPTGIAVIPDGKKVYVANHCKYVGTISVINTTTNMVTKNIIVDENPCGVSATFDGKWIYITTAGDGNESDSGSVSVINTETDTLIPGRVFVGNRPSGIGQFIVSFNESRAETMTALACSSDQYLLQCLVGKPIMLTASVSVSSQETEKPSGKVIFMDGATQVGGADLISGQTTLDTSLLSIGSHLIRARYTGDTNFRPSTSPPFSLTVGSENFWKPVFSEIVVVVITSIITALGGFIMGSKRKTP